MTTKRTLGVAMAGIGVGGTEMLPAFEQMEEIDLIAGADINPLTQGALPGPLRGEGLCEHRGALRGR